MTDPPPYTFRQNDLPKLDIHIDRGTDFDAWRAQWEAYRSLSGLANVDAMKQVQVLMLCLSKETLSVVHNLGLSEAQMRDAAEIIEAMQRYVDGHLNETVERHNFRRRVQQPCMRVNDCMWGLYKKTLIT